MRFRDLITTVGLDTSGKAACVSPGFAEKRNALKIPNMTVLQDATCVLLGFKIHPLIYFTLLFPGTLSLFSLPFTFLSPSGMNLVPFSLEVANSGSR